jgi:hypothetical protein
VNDSVENVEAVDLSPTRAELIARVRARGRQIRARRRFGIAGITALVVIAIAAPAIAIGTRSTSRSVPPATAGRTKGDFLVAVITDATRPPCRSGTLETPVTPACVSLGRAVVTANDVQSASVRYAPTLGGWLVEVRVSQQAIARLATAAGNHTAIVVSGKVWSRGVNPGPSGTTIAVVGDSITRGQAIALATKITGRPPAHIDTKPNLSVRIELPSHTLVSGSSLNGTLVVDNPTSTPIDLSPQNCWQKWAVTLETSSFVNEPLYAQDCRTGPWLVAPGTTRWRFTVVGTYYHCSQSAHPLRGEPRCPPGSNTNTPPLPPGDYSAVLVADSPGFLLDAPPVPVQVVAARA